MLLFFIIVDIETSFQLTRQFRIIEEVHFL